MSTSTPRQDAVAERRADTGLQERAARRWSIGPYVRIARPDHWFKNIFMAPGIVLVFFFDRAFVGQASLPRIAAGLAAACLVASSNYVLNEILDAHRDRFHPQKHRRPIPSGQVSVRVAYVEWLALAAAGLALAVWIGGRFAVTAALLWVMGILYNVPPARLKDKPYADVLSESVNNPIRMVMGWFSTGYGSLPTLSVLLAYWMFGAFLMATKRFAEFRMIGDAARAARYRSSFGYYNQERLLASIVFYASLFAMFLGVFIARYRIELILATPVICMAMAQYLHLGFVDDSPVQRPEGLYRAKRLVGLVTAAALACAVLLFVDIPAVADAFRQWHEWQR